MIYGYCRVSTDKQTNENQQFEIENYSSKNGVAIDRWVKETISSRKSIERRELGRLLKKVKRGDIVITSEISRLGRNILEIMSILQNCLIKDCQIWTIKENYRLGADIQSKVLAFAFGLAAEIERQLISSRTKEALARRLAEGKKLGRPEGSKSKDYKMSGKERQVRNLLERGVAKTKIARILDVNISTIYRFIHTLDLD